MHVAVKAEMSFDNLNLAQLLSPVTLAAGPNDVDGQISDDLPCSRG